MTQPFYIVSGQTAGYLAFGVVDTAGLSTVAAIPPFGLDGRLLVSRNPIVYDISTTATAQPPFTICLAYRAGDFPSGVLPSLYHYFGGAWVDITAARLESVGADGAPLSLVCGEVASFSPFGLFFSPQAMEVTRLKVLKRTSSKPLALPSPNRDSWSFEATLNLSGNWTWAADVDARGLTVTLADPTSQRQADEVVFTGGECSSRAGGNKRRLRCRKPGAALDADINIVARGGTVMVNLKGRFGKRALGAAALQFAVGAARTLNVDLNVGGDPVPARGIATICKERKDRKDHRFESCARGRPNK